MFIWIWKSKTQLLYTNLPRLIPGGYLEWIQIPTQHWVCTMIPVWAHKAHGTFLLSSWWFEQATVMRRRRRRWICKQVHERRETRRLWMDEQSKQTKNCGYKIVDFGWANPIVGFCFFSFFFTHVKMESKAGLEDFFCTLVVMAPHL